MILENLSLWALEKLGSRLIERIDSRPLEFTQVQASYTYSHYVGQNHVREGGEKRICRANLALTVQNRDALQRTIRELILICLINQNPHSFSLYDLAEETWKQDYNIAARSVSRFSWQAAPKLQSLWYCDDGILPFSDSDTVQFCFSYLDEKGNKRVTYISEVVRRRVNPQLIQA